jgi:5-methylthioribose kinase
MFNTEEFKEYYLTSIYSDTLGYAATEMIRRTVGVAKVWDLERNKTHDQMAKIERVIIRIGKIFINKRAELAKDRSFMSIVEQEIIREKGDL